MIKYVIKEKNKEGRHSIIEATGLTDTFTIKQLSDNIKAIEKMKKEQESKKKIEVATVKNILSNFKSIAEMEPKPEDSKSVREEKEKFILALSMYLKSRVIIDETTNNLKNIRKALASEKKTLADVREQTKLYE
jgi:cysteinyl-tRNA synthetase